MWERGWRWRQKYRREGRRGYTCLKNLDRKLNTGKKQQKEEQKGANGSERDENWGDKRQQVLRVCAVDVHMPYF